MKLTNLMFIGLFVLCGSLKTDAQTIPEIRSKERHRVVVEDCVRCEDRAVSLPVAELPGSIGAKPYRNFGTVSVQVHVDSAGNVEKAYAVAGHPFFRPIMEKSALKAKFRTNVVDGTSTKFSAIIVYRIVSADDDKPNEAPPNKVAIVNGMATDLPKPQVPPLPVDVCIGGPVSVLLLIGADGLVKEASAISGNRFLRTSAVNAAKLAKFRHHGHMPPREINGIVVYNFLPSTGCRK
jgi:hypothetical protein